MKCQYFSSIHLPVSETFLCLGCRRNMKHHSCHQYQRGPHKFAITFCAKSQALHGPRRKHRDDANGCQRFFVVRHRRCFSIGSCCNPLTMCEQLSSKVKCTRWFHYHLQTARCHWNSSLQIWFEAAERTWNCWKMLAEGICSCSKVAFDSCRRFSKKFRASHFFHFFHSFVAEGIARSTSETVIFTCAQCTSTSSAYLATAWGWQIWNIHKFLLNSELEQKDFLMNFVASARCDSTDFDGYRATPSSSSSGTNSALLQDLGVQGLNLKSVWKIEVLWNK